MVFTQRPGQPESVTQAGGTAAPREADRWAREIGREMAKTDRSGRMNRRHRDRGGEVRLGGGDLSEPSVSVDLNLGGENGED